MTFTIGVKNLHIIAMTKPTAMTYSNTKTTALPTAMRHSVAMQKYAESVSIYSDRKLPDITGKLKAATPEWVFETCTYY